MNATSSDIPGRHGRYHAALTFGAFILMLLLPAQTRAHWETGWNRVQKENVYVRRAPKSFILGTLFCADHFSVQAVRGKWAWGWADGESFQGCAWTSVKALHATPEYTNPAAGTCPAPETYAYHHFAADERTKARGNGRRPTNGRKCTPHYGSIDPATCHAPVTSRSCTQGPARCVPALTCPVYIQEDTHLYANYAREVVHNHLGTSLAFQHPLMPLSHTRTKPIGFRFSTNDSPIPEAAVVLVNHAWGFVPWAKITRPDPTCLHRHLASVCASGGPVPPTPCGSDDDCDDDEACSPDGVCEACLDDTCGDDVCTGRPDDDPDLCTPCTPDTCTTSPSTTTSTSTTSTSTMSSTTMAPEGWTCCVGSSILQAFFPNSCGAEVYGPTDANLSGCEMTGGAAALGRCLDPLCGPVAGCCPNWFFGPIGLFGDPNSVATTCNGSQPPGNYTPDRCP